MYKQRPQRLACVQVEHHFPEGEYGNRGIRHHKVPPFHRKPAVDPVTALGLHHFGHGAVQHFPIPFPLLGIRGIDPARNIQKHGGVYVGEH
ncbi:hypothetical protein D1872_276020 [compost metagenome]